MRVGGDNGPTFGAVLRGARLGWHWSARHGGFIRLSVEGTKAVVQLHPNSLMPSRKGGDYVCWWEDPGLLDCIPQLRRVVKVRRPIYFTVPLSLEVGATEAAVDPHVTSTGTPSTREKGN